MNNITRDNPTELRFVDFLDKLGMYYHQNRIDEETVYNQYSGIVEVYWPALQSFVIRTRREDKAPDEYKYIEELYTKMVEHDEKANHMPMVDVELSQKEITDYLTNEKNLK